MAGLKILGLLCLSWSIWTEAMIIGKDDRKRGVSEKKPFPLDDVVSKAYSSDVFNGTWLSETEFYYQYGNLLYVFDVTTLETKTLVNFASFNFTSNYKTIVSPDKNFILIRNEAKSIYRHSSLSYFSIYNVKKNSMKKIQDKLISIALWTPTSNAVVYVLDNNIYYYDIKYDKHRQLTDDGEHQKIYNGIPDWVYEEEVLADDTALWISPNGEHLAFATFNDTEVHETAFLRYGDPNDLKNQYPEEVKFRYPKPGTPNPRVTLNLIDLSDHGSTAVPLHIPVDIIGNEPILFAVNWFDHKTVVATWTNRVQNHSIIVSYSVEDQHYYYLLDQSEPRGWMLSTDVAPLYYKNNVLLLKSQTTANKTLGSFVHLTRYRFLNNELSEEIDLSPGRIWVSAIHGVSDRKRVVYFTASPEDKPSEKHLYEVNLTRPADLDNSIPNPTCISCDILTPEGNKCKYAKSIKFSKDFSHYVLMCSGSDVPIINIYDYKHSSIYSWSNNQELRANLAKYEMPQIKNLVIDSYGQSVQIRLYLPSDFDETKKYPMLLNVYGGPQSQRITDNFAVGFETYMAANRRVIYALIDGRGSDSKGTAILYDVYRNLGNAEIHDQIYGVSKLTKMFKWIDKSRIGVWGWSYGGYSTATILTTDTDDIFKCGISVAPVVNWMYYDSIYAERYLGLPTENDNLKRYESSSVLVRATKLEKKRFMLVHGTGDDNVHFQQSMMLSRLLAENDIIFRQLTYADETHHLDHVTTHLYHSMDIFWSECFGYELDGNKNANNTVEYRKGD